MAKRARAPKTGGDLADLDLGRYDVQTSEGVVEMRVRRDPWRVADWLQGIGALGVLAAPLVELGVGTRGDAFMAAAMVAAFAAALAAIVAMIEAEKRRAYLAGCYLQPRRSLAIKRAAGDYRKADAPVVVEVDGRPVGTPSRVVVSGTAITVSTGGGMQATTVFFHAGLVFPDLFVRVESFKDDIEPAVRVASALAAALALPPLDEPVAEPALEHEGMFGKVMLILLDMGAYPALAAMAHAAMGPSVATLLVAGAAWLAVHAACWTLLLRMERAALTRIAVQIHGVVPGWQ